MTREEKELLLKDLCCRIPYRVKVQSYNYEEDIETIETLQEIDSDGYISTFECDTLKNIYKPYLFPMSSMNGEQKTSHNFLKYSAHASPTKLVDWYNKNHFDYRGLIPMGLANDATGLNIYE